MDDHITEQTFDTLFLSPDTLSREEKQNIEHHLEECTMCREHSLKLKEFYQSFQENLSLLPTIRDRAFAEKLLAQKRLALPLKAIVKRNEEALDAYAEVIEPYYRSLPKRIIRYVQIHPVRAAARFSMAAALAAALFFVAKPFKDTNPSYARAKDEFIVVYGKEGQELWRKHIGHGFDINSARDLVKENPDYAVTTVDVDGDGKNEVISIFGWADIVSPLRNSVMCCNADSSVRWTYPFHREIQFGDVKYADDYQMYFLSVNDYDKDGNLDAIAIAGHRPWIPNAIVRLNAKDGSIISEYWHPGVVRKFGTKDIDGDSIDELFFAGKNGEFDRANLLILDPREITGHAPVQRNHTPLGVGAGKEKFYLLFPASDMQKFWSDASSIVTDMKISKDGFIEIMVTEPVNVGGGDLHFFLDSTMKCIKVEASNTFIASHTRLVTEGKLAGQIDETYYENLRKQVQYWDGEKFMHEPTVNRNYPQITQTKPLP